jgi:hypothetical protein
MEGLALKKRLLGTIPEVRALEAEPDIGLLPCNGVLRQGGEEVEALIQRPPRDIRPPSPWGSGKAGKPARGGASQAGKGLSPALGFPKTRRLRAWT